MPALHRRIHRLATAAALALGALGPLAGAQDEGGAAGRERAPGGRGQDEPARPNILLVLADDMGFSDVGCYGGEIETPQLDRLAAGGLRFTQFYNAGRCCPTRASLLTGLWPHQAGVGDMMSDEGSDAYRGDLSPAAVTIAEVLKDAGYATFLSGKWHVTKQIGLWYGLPEVDARHNWPRQRGFERFYGTLHGAASFYDPVTLTLDDEPQPSPRGDFYYTDAISEHAARFLREHFAAGDGRPFFCHLAYTAPHWPLHARARDVERCAGRYDGGWDELRRARLARMVELGIVDASWALSPRDELVRAWEDEPRPEWRARAMEVYAAQVECMDRGIGRILSVLEQHGALANTLVLFLADNGGSAEEAHPLWKGGLHVPRSTRAGRPVRVGNDPRVLPGPEDTYQSYGRPWANASNTPFRLYKHFVHEGGIATPLIAHWPARIADAGALRHRPGHVIDVMATCVDAARASYPRERGGLPVTPMEGESLLAVFERDDPERGPLFWEHEGNAAVRLGRWKLVARHDPAGRRWELFDLALDRAETRDLAGAEPERVARLAALWDAWAERCGVRPWPLR